MAATPFRAINWTPNELVGEDKMDQLANNVQWLYENTARSQYTQPGGLRRVEGTRLLGGRVVIQKKPKTGSANVNVDFNNFFSSGCSPIITTGTNSAGERAIFVATAGLGGNAIPDTLGFQVRVEVANGTKKKKPSIKKPFYVHWLALGY